MERENRIKRLYFRSAHRGSKEADLVLGPFAAARLPLMSDEELIEFEAFLEENDHDIWDWVTGKSQPQDGRYRRLIELFQEEV